MDSKSGSKSHPKSDTKSGPKSGPKNTRFYTPFDYDFINLNLDGFPVSGFLGVPIKKVFTKNLVADAGPLMLVLISIQ